MKLYYLNNAVYPREKSVIPVDKLESFSYDTTGEEIWMKLKFKGTPYKDGTKEVTLKYKTADLLREELDKIVEWYGK